MAFKMKGSSYKMGGHKTKATMAYMKSPLEQAKPDYPDIDGDGNTTESMKKAAADKKSPMEMKSPMKQEKYYEGEEFVNMTPAWAGTDELEKLKQKLKTLEEGSDEHHNLYNKIMTMREQWDQSQKALLEEERRNDMQTQAAAK